MGEDKNVVYHTSNYIMPQKLAAPCTTHQQVRSKTQDKLQRDKKGKAYITLDTFANAGEVIEVGKGRFQYKITMQGGFKNGNQTYYIKRTDGEDITNADYLNIQAGDYVYFMSRQTGFELMDEWLEVHGIDTTEVCVEEEPICNENDFGCCPDKPKKCRHTVTTIKDEDGNTIQTIILQSGEKETVVIENSIVDIGGSIVNLKPSEDLTILVQDADGNDIAATLIDGVLVVDCQGEEYFIFTQGDAVKDTNNTNYTVAI